MNRMFYFIASMFFISYLASGNINWSFPPEILSTTGINSKDPRVVMDPNGNAVAIWLENGIVNARFKPAGLSWGTASTLSGSSASSPTIAIDSSGNATAVWIEGSGVKAATKKYNHPWSSSVSLSKSGALNPSLTVDAAGNAVATWARNDDIEVTVKLFGNNWQNQGVIKNPVGTAYSPKVAMGGSGSDEIAYIVWYASATSGDRVYSSSKRLTSGAWTKAAAISLPSSQAAYPTVAVDMKGNATAIWFSFNQIGSVFSSVIVQAATQPYGGNWSDPVNLSAPGIRDPSTLYSKIGYDGSGNAIAIWSTSFDNETFDIQSSILPAYGNWMQPNVLVSNNLYASQVDQSVVSFGEALALFLFSNGAGLQIQSSEIDITNFMPGVWSVPLTLSTGMQNGYPSIAANLTGNTFNAAAVWLNTNGVINNVVSSYGTKTLVSPPSNLAVVQSSNNLGVFIEYYNTLSWTASTDPNTAGYLIYRNGTFLAQVPANVLELVDNNQMQNGSVTYGVAAVDSLGSHSPIITINFQ